MFHTEDVLPTRRGFRPGERAIFNQDSSTFSIRPGIGVGAVRWIIRNDNALGNSRSQPN